MPDKKTLEKARKAKRSGKASTTQAGSFVGEEMRHVKKGKHGAKSRKQAIAIGLSKARRSGVKVPRKKGAAAGKKKTGGRKSAARSKRTARKKS